MARTEIKKIAIYSNGVLLSSDLDILNFTGAGQSTSITGTSPIEITETINGGGGGGFGVATQTVTGTINGSNTTFSVATSMASALVLYLAGSPYQPGVDFTVSGTTITFTTAPSASLAGQPFWIAYATSGSFFADTVSGTINGSNMTFTVPNTITTAETLFLAGTPYQPIIDFTYSGTTITFVSVASGGPGAPSASLAGQPFWLLHT